MVTETVNQNDGHTQDSHVDVLDLISELNDSTTASHHSPGCTMAQYGKRRVEGARKPASGTAERIRLGKIT